MKSMHAIHRTPWSCLGLFAALLAVVGCGGGTDGPPPVDLPPTVIQFSPAYAPYDFTTGSQAPVFTNAGLTVATDASFPGQIAVFFRSDFPLQASSFFVSGNPLLGPDADAVEVLHRVAGVGWVLVPADVMVGTNHLALTPLGPYAPLQNGQYRVRIGPAGRDAGGRPVTPAPVFHSFYVNADSDAPLVISTSPENNAINVPHGASSPDILICFDESILSTSVTPETIEVFDDTAIVSTTQLTPMPGYPRLQVEDDGSTLPTNGLVVVWRAMGGLPTGAIMRVRVRGLAGGNSPRAIEDLNGREMVDDLSVRFFTAP